jgi:hypothetical protein
LLALIFQSALTSLREIAEISKMGSGHKNRNKNQMILYSLHMKSFIAKRCMSILIVLRKMSKILEILMEMPKKSRIQFKKNIELRAERQLGHY